MRSFGFHPCSATWMRPARRWRASFAGSNTTEHHFALHCDAFEQIASRALEELEILVRCAISGATHAFTEDLPLSPGLSSASARPASPSPHGAGERLWRE
jgi:hypothetical protein